MTNELEELHKVSTEYLYTLSGQMGRVKAILDERDLYSKAYLLDFLEGLLGEHDKYDVKNVRMLKLEKLKRLVKTNSPQVIVVETTDDTSVYTKPWGGVKYET